MAREDEINLEELIDTKDIILFWKKLPRRNPSTYTKFLLLDCTNNGIIPLVIHNCNKRINLYPSCSYEVKDIHGINRISKGRPIEYYPSKVYVGKDDSKKVLRSNGFQLESFPNIFKKESKPLFQQNKFRNIANYL